MKKIYIYGNNFPYIEELKKGWNIVDCAENSDVIVSYGGDGTLLETMHIANGIPIIPIRNYALCGQHEPFNCINFARIISNNEFEKYTNIVKINNLKTFIDGKMVGDAFSEVCIRNINSRNAIRFDVFVNDLTYVKDIIGDGIIVATSYGSTGYFRSITRTMFKHGVGLAFNNPTQPTTNIITDEMSNFSIKIKRCGANVQIDNVENKSFNINENSTVEIKMSNDNTANILFLGQFMCTHCREKRHGGIEYLYNFGDFLYKDWQ